MNSRTRKHWLVFTSISFVFAAFAGIMNNVIGVFYTPVSESLGILRGSFALHATIANVVVGIVSLFAPRIILKFGWKRSLLLGVMCSFIGTAGMGFTDQLIIFYLLGVIRGIGGGLMGMVPMTLILNNWFYEKNGLVISLASAFSGLIGMTFAPIFSNVIANFGWRFAFIVMGIIIVLLSLPAILIPHSATPEQDGLQPYGLKVNTEDETMNNEVPLNKKSIPLKALIISIIAMMIFSFLHTNTLGMNQHLASYGESIGMSIQASGYMLSAVMFGNILFKVLLGPISDRIGAIKSTIILIGIIITGLLILILFEQPLPAIFSAFLFGAVFSVGSVALPLLSTQFFGKIHSTRIFPILSFTSSIGSALSNTVVGYIYDFTGSYQTAFFIGIGFQVVNLFMLFIAYRHSTKVFQSE